METENLSDMEKEQFSYWLSKTYISRKLYKEPLLGEYTVQMVRYVCDLLNQTDEVFVTSVEVLEAYVYKKLSFWHLSDNISIITCCVALSTKLVGILQSDLRMYKLSRLIAKFFKKKVDVKTLKRIEIDIISTVKSLPLTNTCTDLCMLLQYSIKDLKLKTDLEPLCLELLNILYISRRKIFLKLKKMYMNSSDASAVYQQLIWNKFYYPGGIVACALYMTRFAHFLDVNQIIWDIAKMGHMHYEHIQFLSNAIHELIEDYL